jgi:DNA polymerase III sliding clamp (beta) subunit (PCNA family)
MFMDMPNKRLKADIDEAFKTGGDEILFTCNKQRLRLYTKGITGEWEKEYNKTNSEAFSKFNVESLKLPEIESTFSLDYLRDVVAACNTISPTVRIAFGDSSEGKPLYMNYLVSYPGKLSFWLASQK